MTDEVVGSPWHGLVRTIFERQQVLMDEYQKLEGFPKPPIAIQTSLSQELLKKFAWRVIEELGESYEAWENYRDHQEARERALEELADAMHFFIEICIFASVGPEQLLEEVPHWPSIFSIPTIPNISNPALYWRATYSLTIAMHELRNRPWKKRVELTSENSFRHHLVRSFGSMVRVWAGLGYGMHHLEDHYFRKANVNTQRQRSGY